MVPRQRKRGFHPAFFLEEQCYNHLMRTYAFIDASNLFYGGEKSLGWKIDYRKLLAYLKKKYGVKKAFYFGGVELYGFQFDYLTQDSVPVSTLLKHLSLLWKKRGEMSEGALTLLERHLGRVKFYRKLEQFGYTLFLKPVKRYEQEDGTFLRKANCDVEMTLRLVLEQDNFDRAIVLSGDGDFLPILRHLKKEGKEVFVLSRGPRTAKEIRKFAAGNFRDFEYLETKVSFRR